MNYILQKYHRSVRNVAMVCVAAVVLGSSTYAWFVSNNTVKGTTTNISAQSNAPFLKIDSVAVTASSGTTKELTGAETKLYPSQVVGVGADGKSAVGEETLRIVYAKDNETGEGNDSTAKAGWTSIQKVNGKPKLDTVTYPYVYTGHYTDQRITGAKNWAATKDGENFTIPTNSEAIATNVGYDGIAVHVYI